MKIFLYLSLILVCWTHLVLAKKPDAATLSTLKPHIPKGLTVIDFVDGDFNGDKLKDIILVLDSAQYADQNETSNRQILILQKTKNGYVRNAFCKHAILGSHDGGVFGDPYESISLNKNVLSIFHYGGSNWRWSRIFTFRFQQNAWYLIGNTESSYWTAGNCEDAGAAAFNQSDINFSTSKAHIIRTQENACKPYKDSWLTFKKNPLVNLTNFKVEKNYLPAEIKD